MQVLAETLFSGRRYTVAMRRPKLGIIGWLAVQAVGIAVHLVGSIIVEPGDTTGDDE